MRFSQWRRRTDGDQESAVAATSEMEKTDGHRYATVWRMSLVGRDEMSTPRNVRGTAYRVVSICRQWIGEESVRSPEPVHQDGVGQAVAAKLCRCSAGLRVSGGMLGRYTRKASLGFCHWWSMTDHKRGTREQNDRTNLPVVARHGPFPSHQLGAAGIFIRGG